MAKRRALIRLPTGAAAQVRADLRRFGPRAGARLWGISPAAALRIAAGLQVKRSAIVTVLRKIVAEVSGDG